MLIKGGEPFFFPGGKTGCLLAHGLPGTPKEMRPLGEALAEHGYSVLAPRLAGHATNQGDLNRVRWPDWLASVEDGWHLLTGVSERIFLLGLSLGGILSLITASRLPVLGVVAMSTPYELPPDPRLPYLNLIKWIIPSINVGASDWQDKDAQRENLHYPELPTRAIIELRHILAELRTALPLIEAPTLLIHARGDENVPPGNMQKIYDHLECHNKEMLWLDKGGHNVVLDADRQRVFNACLEFIEKSR